jgi:hypothetical protein
VIEENAKENWINVRWTSERTVSFIPAHSDVWYIDCNPAQNFLVQNLGTLEWEVEGMFQVIFSLGIEDHQNIRVAGIWSNSSRIPNVDSVHNIAVSSIFLFTSEKCSV